MLYDKCQKSCDCCYVLSTVWRNWRFSTFVPFFYFTFLLALLPSLFRGHKKLADERSEIWLQTSKGLAKSPIIGELAPPEHDLSILIVMSCLYTCKIVWSLLQAIQGQLVSYTTCCVFHQLLGALIEAFTEERSLLFMIVLIAATPDPEHC